MEMEEEWMGGRIDGKGEEMGGDEGGRENWLVRKINEKMLFNKREKIQLRLDYIGLDTFLCMYVYVLAHTEA